MHCCCSPRAWRDFHRVDLAWPALVLLISAAALAADYTSAAGAGAAASSAALSTASEAALERLGMTFAPIAALMTTQKALAFVPWPWSLDTWAQVTGPIVAASPQMSSYVLSEMVPFANRTAWEARMSAIYNRRVEILEFARTSE